MNKSAAIALAIIGSLVLLGLVFGAGVWLGHINLFSTASAYPYPMMQWGDESYHSSMMGRSYSGMAYNRMACNNEQADVCMNAWSATTSTTSTTPISMDQAKEAFQNYLDTINNDDLEIAEIMIFDNNAYARITEKSTGIGAMELLAEPGTLAVHPEYGPNMMWNQKYGHMTSAGYDDRFGGMMGRGMMGGTYYNGTLTQTSEMTVTEAQALEIAQDYLDEQVSGAVTAEEANPFYGYYTLDFLEDGAPVGMLSVNGYTGQVFLHTWHGTFIDMLE